MFGDKFMHEMHLRLVDHLQKIKKKYKTLNKLESQDIFTKMN